MPTTFPARILAALVSLLLLLPYPSGSPHKSAAIGLAWAEPAATVEATETAQTAEPPEAETAPSNAAADPAASDPDQQLLEKSLSILEINQELTRVQTRKDDLQQQLSSSREQLAEQERLLEKRKKRAGVALSDYFMGKQERTLGALFHTRSLSDLLRALDLIDLMARSDRQAITDYRSRAQQLRSGYAVLKRDQEALLQLEQTLLARRLRQQTLQRQLEEGINGSSDPDQLRGQINELQQLWESEGRDKLRTYFRALSKAMNKLPDWLKDRPNYLKLDKSGYILTLPDEALNQFLQEQDPSLAGFSFRFEQDKIVAAGSEDGLSVEASGKYEIVEEPKNGIRFRISELSFNGLKLPQETIDELEQSFNLGFYPGKIISFLKIDSVDVQDRKLVLIFKISF
ncbi:N-terminal domain of peptidoglycan hydrolase CwlO-containing protein [Paenibacillaceae bacterium GAS479]|nr:N-terminal domain of peptidoglycan hydrolase CwlO-containing protein [Paenibacillaceae bacterium GAS479]